jgi:hypothetical protein
MDDEGDRDHILGSCIPEFKGEFEWSNKSRGDASSHAVGPAFTDLQSRGSKKIGFINNDLF